MSYSDHRHSHAHRRGGWPEPSPVGDPIDDERTPEQRAADETLSAAIKQTARAYKSIDQGTVITNWAVLGTGLGADGAGDLYPDFILLPNNGIGMSHSQLIGLIRAAQVRVEKSYMELDE